MPYKSRWHVSIPVCSLPTVVFQHPSHPLDDQTPCFLEAARPDTHYFTQSSYRLWCQRLALGLQQAKGFEKGDRVLLFSGNDLLFPVVFMGVIMAGGIFTGANPNYVARELAYQLKDSEAKFLLCAEASIDVGVEAAELAGLPRENLFVFNSTVYDDDTAASLGSRTKHKGYSYRNWGELVAAPEDAKTFQWEDLRGSDDACHRTLALNYSSGTTGHPKGVEITHTNYVSNCLQFNHLASLRKDYVALTERARWLNFLPLYHAMSQAINIVCALLRGVPVYIMKRFDFIQMLEYVQKYRITALTLVPPVVVALAKYPGIKKYDLSSVETAGSGAAPLGLEVTSEFNRLWPDGQMHLTQGWGMTEVTCGALGWDPNDKSKSNSVGELNPNCSAMIIAEDGKTEITARGPDARGELWFQGPSVMKGYWRNPKATAETKTADGWLKTGDIAYVDSKGKFFIVDRKKELIKVKGNQVAPAELEALLLDHPAIMDAAIIGLQMEDGEERPRAYVVLQPDEKAQYTPKEDIVRFVEARVSRHKRITGGVVYLETIPKNPSGKILRRWLRDKAKEEMREANSRL